MSGKTLQEEFKRDGLVVLPGLLSKDLVKKLTLELEQALAEDIRYRPNAFDKGMVHNCMARGAEMRALLDHIQLNKYIDELFIPNSIIYAYQSSSLFPKNGNYGSRIHVDCPRWIQNYTTNIGLIIPLTNFTHKNGATYFLRGSHRSSDIPNDCEFYEKAERLICNAGDLVVFDARLVHAAGINNDDTVRHALTINLCRPFMRQRFDFPRLLTESQIRSLGKNGRRLIGMDVRMPTCLDEFYLPAEQRLYKPGQE